MSDQVLRLVPVPGCEQEIRRNGGLAAVLLRAQVNLGMALTADEVHQMCGGGAAVGDRSDGCERAASMAEQRVGAPADESAANKALEGAPAFRWREDEQFFFRLEHYEALQGMLQRATPSLLGPGGAIPPSTLRAYRWVPVQGLGHGLLMQRLHDMKRPALVVLWEVTPPMHSGM